MANKFQNNKKIPTVLINGDVIRKVKQVRVVGDNHTGEMSSKAALELAQNDGLDLVLVNPKSAICKIMDYKKYVFDQKKRAKTNRKPKAETDIKEVKLGSLDCDINDMTHKAKNMIKFISKAGKCKLSLQLRGGRAMRRKFEGGNTMNKFLQVLNQHPDMPTDQAAAFIRKPELNGRRWQTTIKFVKEK